MFFAPPNPDHFFDVIARRRRNGGLAEEEQARFAFGLDATLRRLARGHTLLVRALAGGLARLCEGDRLRKLGYVGIGDYARERVGCSGRQGQEMAWLGRRLREVPVVDTLHLKGHLSYAAVRELLRSRLPDDLLAAIAPSLVRCTAQEVREAIKRCQDAIAETPEATAKPGDFPLHAPEDDDEEPRAGRWVETVASPFDVIKYETAVELARRYECGNVSESHCLGLFMAEFLNGEGAAALAAAPPADNERTAEAPPSPFAELRRAWAEIERVLADITDHWRHLDWTVPDSRLPDGLDCRDENDVHGIDRRLRTLRGMSQRIDWHLMQILPAFDRQRMYLELEFASFDGYARERLFMSRSKARGLLTLARRLRSFPQVAWALRQGHIGETQAASIIQVAQPWTEERWIEHATTTTVKLLAQDVAAAVKLKRDEPDTFDRTGGLPPQVPAVQTCAPADDAPRPRKRRQSLSAFHQALEAVRSGLRGDVADDLLAVRRDLTIRFWLPAELEETWSHVERACRVLYGRASVLDCLGTILDAFLSTWMDEAMACIRSHPVLERDGFRCAVPICSRRGPLNAHHLKYRSRGGGNEPANLSSCCEAHHQRGIHDGYIRVRGEAPDGLTWEPGLASDGSAHMVVEGRRVTHATPALDLEALREAG